MLFRLEIRACSVLRASWRFAYSADGRRWCCQCWDANNREDFGSGGLRPRTVGGLRHLVRLCGGCLLGLAFVAISFNLDTILKFKALPGRAVETLAFFAYALAASLLIQLPGLSSVPLGIGEAILAAGIAGLAVRGVPRWRQERDDPLSWRLTHHGPAFLTALLAVVGAVATMTTSLGGLYWLAAAMAVATASGIINSWVLLVEIKR